MSSSKKSRAVSRAKALGLNVNTKLPSSGAAASPKVSAALRSADWRHRDDLIDVEKPQRSAPHWKTEFSLEEIKLPEAAREHSPPSDDSEIGIRRSYRSGQSRGHILSPRATQDDSFRVDEDEEQDLAYLAEHHVKDREARKYWVQLLKPIDQKRQISGKHSGSIVEATPTDISSLDPDWDYVEHPTGEIRAVKGQKRFTTDLGVADAALHEEFAKSISPSVLESMIKETINASKSSEKAASQAKLETRILNKFKFEALLGKLRTTAEEALRSSSGKLAAKDLSHGSMNAKNREKRKRKSPKNSGIFKPNHEAEYAHQTVTRSLERSDGGGSLEKHQASSQKDKLSSEAKGKAKDRSGSTDSGISGCVPASKAEKSSTLKLNPKAEEFSLKAETKLTVGNHPKSGESLPIDDAIGRPMSACIGRIPPGARRPTVEYSRPKSGAMDGFYGPSTNRGPTPFNADPHGKSTADMVSYLSQRVSQLESKIKMAQQAQAPRQDVSGGWYPHPGPVATPAPPHVLPLVPPMPPMQPMQPMQPPMTPMAPMQLTPHVPPMPPTGIAPNGAMVLRNAGPAGFGRGYENVPPSQMSPGYPGYGGYGRGMPLQNWAKNTFGPKPVQKPKASGIQGDLIQSMKQQEYEEYLEHLRATDPEYAMKCRQRQARRAERQSRSTRY